MIGLYELNSNDSPRPKLLDNELQLGPHDLYAPDETPSSITESRVLLDNAIEDFREHEINLENLSDFPLTIQAWLKKHKRVLFKDSNIISAADVEKTYERDTHYEGRISIDDDFGVDEPAEIVAGE